jgi:hypothetical protein
MSTFNGISSKPAWFPDDRRAGARLRTHLPVTVLTLSGGTYSAFLMNASASGFRVRSDYGATIGRYLLVDVPNFTQYSGWVTWANSGEFGFEVANPIPRAVIDHIVALAAEA